MLEQQLLIVIATVSNNEPEDVLELLQFSAQALPYLGFSKGLPIPYDFVPSKDSPFANSFSLSSIRRDFGCCTVGANHAVKALCFVKDHQFNP